MKLFKALNVAFCSLALLETSLSAITTYTISDLTDTTPPSSTSIRGVIEAINTAANTNGAQVLITTTGSVLLNSNLPPLLYPATITANGANVITLSPNGAIPIRGLFFYPGPTLTSNLNVSVQGIDFQNLSALGGSGGTTLGGSPIGCGGGGGGGLGGAFFVGPSSNVTLTTQNIAGCSAVGGLGGTCVLGVQAAGGGGGGLGGQGGSVLANKNGAGGGGGLNFPGGAGSGVAWGAGGGGSQSPGGAGGNGPAQSGFGGLCTPFASAGNGGSYPTFPASAGQQFGGGGGDDGVASGGFGGFGGGGGGGGFQTNGQAGGSGGFGGGGGGGGIGNPITPVRGGAGGYAGGGGGGYVFTSGGVAGFGAASGNSSGLGGGGAGLGGAIFIHESAICNLNIVVSNAGFNGNTVSVQDPIAQALGPDIFMMEKATLNIQTALGNASLPNPIISDYAVNNALTGGITFNGSPTGALTLNGSNTFSGGILVNSGVLSMGAGSSLINLCPLVVASGATFDVSQAGPSGINISNIISNNNLDGIINIGSSLLSVNLFNDQGSFNGSFSSSSLGQLVFNQTVNATTSFTYSGTSNFLGTCTINSGVDFFMGPSATLGNNATFLINSGGVLDVSLVNSGFVLGNILGVGAINVGQASINIQPTLPDNFAGNIEGSGNITVLGTNLTLSGTSSFNGTCQINSSAQLSLSNASFPANVNLAPFGILVNQNTSSIGLVTGSGLVQVGSGALNINPQTAGTFSGQFSGPPGSNLNFNGTSSITLSGISDTFNGNVNIYGGSVKLVDNGTLPADIYIQAPGVLDISGKGPLLTGNNVALQNVTGSGTINLGSQNIIFSNTSPPTGTFSGNVIGSGDLTFSGAYPFQFSGTLSTFGQVYIYPNGLKVSEGGNFGSVTQVNFQNGSLTLQQITGSINIPNLSGSGSIIAGTAFVSFNNSTATSFNGSLSSNGSITFNVSPSLSLNTNGDVLGSVTLTNGVLYTLNGAIFNQCSLLEVQSPSELNTEMTLGPTNLSNVSGSGIINHSLYALNIINNNPQNLSGEVLGLGNVSFSGPQTATVTFSEGFFTDSPLIATSPIIIDVTGEALFLNTIVVDNLTINGPGQVQLDNAVTANQISLIQGITAMNGFVSVGDLVMSSSATLEGTGNISVTSPFLVSGSLAPGNPTGFLFIQAPAGVFMTQDSNFVINLEPPNVNTLFVTGTVSIDPGSSLVVNSNGQFTTTHESFDILSVNLGSLSGQFSQLFTNLDPSQITLNYYPQVLELTVTAKLHATGNAENVAVILNQYMLSNDPQIQNLLINLIDAQNKQEQQNALDQLHPGVFKASAVMLESYLDNFMLSMVKEAELDAITAKLCVCDTPKTSSKSHQWDSELFEDSYSQNACQKDHKVHLFLKGLGTSNYQKTHTQYVGYKNLGGGLFFGGAYDYKDRIRLSAALCYQAGKVTSYKNRGYTDLSQYAAMFLAHSSLKKYEWALGYSFSYNQEKNTRKVNFQNIHQTAKNTHALYLQSLFLKGGYFVNAAQDFSWGPYDYLSLMLRHEKGLQESGAGILDLTTNSYNSGYLRNELGIKMNRCLKTSYFDLKSFFKVAYVQQAHFSASSYTTQFIYMPPEYTVTGWSPTRALALFGFGLNFGYGPDKCDVGLLYDVEATHNYVGQRFELGFSFHF